MLIHVLNVTASKLWKSSILIRSLTSPSLNLFTEVQLDRFRHIYRMRWAKRSTLLLLSTKLWASQVAQRVKNPLAMQERQEMGV